MVLLVLFAFCWGPGNFWQMFTCVLIHILMMSVLHFVTSKRSESEDHLSMRLMYNCMINGVSNLYLHNLILMEVTHGKTRKSSDSTFFRQVLFDSIFVMENMVIVTLLYVMSEPLGFQTKQLLFIFFGHIVGLMMKWMYYSLFHLWRNSRVLFHCNQRGQ
jgi:hypothetical protein